MEFEKNIIATEKEINDAFENNFNVPEFLSFKYFEEKNNYRKESDKKVYGVKLRVPIDFITPKGHTVSIDTIKKYINNYSKTRQTNKITEEKTMDLKEQFEDMKDILDDLMKTDYENFVKALISIEKDVDDINVLDNIYEEYMENDATGFLSEGIDDMIDEYMDKDAIRDLDDKELEENDLEENKTTDDKKRNIKSGKNQDDKNINGYMATNVEIKKLKARDGKTFRAANFVVAQNDDMGNAHYTSCTAYNDKIDKVKDFKSKFIRLKKKLKLLKNLKHSKKKNKKKRNHQLLVNSISTRNKLKNWLIKVLKNLKNKNYNGKIKMWYGSLTAIIPLFFYAMVQVLEFSVFLFANWVVNYDCIWYILLMKKYFSCFCGE